MSSQPDFKTKSQHRKLSAVLRPTPRRPDGHRQRPVLIRLDPEPGVEPSAKPPVRIFIGTEPAQYRAERVLVWEKAVISRRTHREEPTLDAGILSRGP